MSIGLLLITTIYSLSRFLHFTDVLFLFLGPMEDSLSHLVVMSPWAPVTVTISQTIFVFYDPDCFEEYWSSVW